ncbi:hypothetical protein Tco_0697645, partial [Tanacetum coccineum]
MVSPMQDTSFYALDLKLVVYVKVLGICGKLDAFVLIPDDGDMAFLRKKVKSRAAVGKRVLLQIIKAKDLELRTRKKLRLRMNFVKTLDFHSSKTILVPRAISYRELANLPPPNNDPNVPKDEHAPAPEHAPIAPNTSPIQPSDYLANDDEEPEEEEEPIPEQAPAAPARFAPQWIGGHDPNNNNGWNEEDDEDEVGAKEEDKEEIEDEEDEEMEVEDNDDENDAEIIHPYEESDPLN